ncbi:MAG: hypothetical protein L6R42_005352 [Xanthoria sp. 1 TBL-2021]|nr:MAG: hypothetical protein L6R42_005352 [Xanthoria sp. 1 TBL-2021]
MNTKESAMELVRYFVKQRTDKIVLDLQDDLVTENKKLAHTAAGKEACGQLSEEVEKMKLQVEDAKLALQEAFRNHDKQARERYKESVDWTKKLKKLQNENRTSAQRMQRDFEDATKRHEAEREEAGIPNDKTIRINVILVSSHYPSPQAAKSIKLTTVKAIWIYITLTYGSLVPGRCNGLSASVVP